MRLSLLDRSRTRRGQPEGAALRQTIVRAQRAEALGLERFWVAEHHAVPGIASGSPAVLLAAIGQVTERIRIGSGGVMLPQHQPLVVAEQFRMLEGLFPGRIDLGAGRSLGFVPAVRRALRREGATSEEFADDLAELRAFLHDDADVTARPAVGPVPLHVLATRSGAATAARLGLPLVVGGPIVLSPALATLLGDYRRAFRPHGASEPHVILSADVFIADTPERAAELALPEAWSMSRTREVGEFLPLEPVDEIRAQRWSTRARTRIDEHLAGIVLGTRDQVAERLARLASSSGADELMASTSTFDVDALAELDASFASLAGEI
ncbi:MsnO8 family LLM class oxidoreductase [Microbacterium sp. gxy059]|uniref:MsnO8 family LLM class oxidoreductase n=1 Tax=Microbacterium sp. gxy059 TaxID=2957199 RepID=UPI003D98B607